MHVSKSWASEKRFVKLFEEGNEISKREDNERLRVIFFQVCY